MKETGEEVAKSKPEFTDRAIPICGVLLNIRLAQRTQARAGAGALPMLASKAKAIAMLHPFHWKRKLIGPGAPDSRQLPAGMPCTKSTSTMQSGGVKVPEANCPIVWLPKVVI